MGGGFHMDISGATDITDTIWKNYVISRALFLTASSFSAYALAYL
jgi:hypothetical protein